MLAIENKWQRIVLETDSQELHDIVSEKSRLVDWRVRPLILDIQRKLRVIPALRLSIVRRGANAAADWLAIQTKECECLTRLDICHSLWLEF